MKWIWLKYNDLDDSQLRDISELRKSFFEADQQDPVKDEYDVMSFHLLGLMNSDLVAYGRVIPPHGEFINPYLTSAESSLPKNSEKKVLVKLWLMS